jgi:heme oxygenase (biliverdin-producing, ferredoxin)
MCSNGELLVVALRERRWDQLFRLETTDEEARNSTDNKDTGQSTGDLANALKEGTKVVHALAERASFVTKLRRGEIPRAVYAQLLLRLYHVYTCMERLLTECSAKHEVLATLHFPKELNRANNLRRDLCFFLGEHWEQQESSAPSPVTLTYQAALESCAARNPILLVAHAYTRYLGDLSGGQIIKRLAKKTLQLDGDDGTQFYCFEHVESPRTFKQLYRTRLDHLPLQPGEVGRWWWWWCVYA